jgi:predicted nucleic acid-binding protein
VAALVDTSILVYRFDHRFPAKQRISNEVLRRGIDNDDIRVPHQAVLEFFAAVTRPMSRRSPLLTLTDARRETEELLKQFVIIYPNEDIVRTAILGQAAYQLSWFDAHIWAYADHYALEKIISEDFEHDRLYGAVRAVNPFLSR